MSRSPHSGPALGVALALLPGLAGCGQTASVTGPTARAARACVVAPTDVGVPRALLPGTSCVTLGEEPASYAVAFFDSRFADAARSFPERLAPELEEFSVRLRAGKDVGPPATPSRAPLERRDAGDDRSAEADAGAATGDVVRLSRSAADGACAAGPGFGVFCRERPWSVGDTLTLPAPFGRFTGETPRPVEVFAVQGPFAFTVARSLREPERMRLAPILENLGKVGILRVLPLLKRSLVDRPVHTSTGSQQLLVDVVFDRIPVCVCGVAVGDEIDGIGVVGVSLRFPDGIAFAADRIGLFAHELTHVWQLAHEARRSSDAVLPPTTVWALEGGADLIRQEILRDLSLQPLAGNRDASQSPTNIYLDRLFRSLKVANGRIRAGYGQSAGFLRHLFLEATRAGALYESALSAVLLGALEGWHRPADPTLAGDGLTGRMDRFVPGFDPATAVLEYALANAADDRTANGDLQNYSVLESWRESEGSTFVPAAELRGAGGVSVTREAGSVGYVYVEHDGGPRSLGLETDVAEVRWMMVRFE